MQLSFRTRLAAVVALAMSVVQAIPLYRSEEANLLRYKTSSLDAPSLQLQVVLGGNNLTIHGQAAFDIFARPVVSTDKASIRYDGFTTFSRGGTQFTYMIVDGAGYVVTTSEGTRMVECLSSVSPFDLILPALNNASVVSSTMLGGESIDCPSGSLLETSFGGVDFAICPAGASGVSVLGTSGPRGQAIDIAVTIEYLSSPLESLSAPTLNVGDGSCAVSMLPIPVTPTALALLTGDVVQSLKSKV